jgi:Tol biopolymer transport system component
MRRWAPLLGLAALTAAMVLAFVFRPAIPPPRVVASTQVTKDGRGKDSMATDGSRIYFSVTSGYLFSLHEVSLTGGAEAPIETSIESPTVEDISPDHSELLIGNCKIPIELQCPLFALPVLGQSARRLGGIEADGATWSHDGKEIVYANGHSVYRMRADGSEPVKIVSVAEGGGYPSWPRWAPDGRRLRFTVSTGHGRESLWEVAADGSNLHPVLPGWSDPPTECCGSWTPNGKYFVFTSGRGGAQNLWAIREAPSMFYKASKEPVQLTIGPTPNSLPLVSPDGKKVFVATAQTRGEMVRYSSASHQFLPYLSGISAICVNFSPDGKWVAYSSYPDTTLWRSKIDGSEAVQLTFPPMTVLQPRWSPDGTRIAFMGSEPGKAFKVYVVPSSGGRVEEAMPGNHFGADPNWSPDGNELLIGRYASEVAPGEPLNLQILNLRTHEMSKVPGSDDLWSPRWSGDGRYILAVRRDGGWLMLYDTATQKWSPLVKMVVDWPEWSRKADYIYFYGAEAGGGQGLFRVRVSDRKVELVFALRDFRQPPDIGWGSWKGLAPDESPILLRDAGVQDIYALDVDFP